MPGMTGPGFHFTGEDTIAPLIEACAARDRAAFRALYSLAAPKLMGVLLRMLGQRPEAEEALQEVFTRIWLRADRFDRHRGQGMAWLVAVARNHAIDRLRARPEAAGADEMPDVADPAPRAETRLVAMGEARRIAECLATLDPDRAAALTGAYLDGLSYAHLAERHGLPLNTLRTWLRRGLMKLKECLEK